MRTRPSLRSRHPCRKDETLLRPDSARFGPIQPDPTPHYQSCFSSRFKPAIAAMSASVRAKPKRSKFSRTCSGFAEPS